MATAKDDPLRRIRAEDAYNLEFMRRFYAARETEIRASGNPVRIRLLNEWQARNAQRG